MDGPYLHQMNGPTVDSMNGHSVHRRFKRNEFIDKVQKEVCFISMYQLNRDNGVPLRASERRWGPLVEGALGEVFARARV